jgi:drug/metabolite transporter (DMT)-like permease
MRGAIIFASQYLLYLTIHELGLSSGLILYNLGPIFLIVMFTMFGNKLKIQDIVLITLSFIGVLVFFDFEFKLSNMGMFLGITAAVLYAASQYINANMAKDKTDPKLIIMLVNLAASAIAAVYLLFFVGEPPQFSHMHVSTWLIITAMGLATYFNQYLRIIAFKLVDNPNTIVYLTYFCIPFSLLFTYFEGTMIAPDQIYGSIIILGGATVQGYLSRKMAKSRKTVEEPTESSLPEAVSNS